MRFYIITGERSGDLHAANLIQAISRLLPEAKFRGTGGEYMMKAGVEIFKHYKEISFMGIWEVLKNLYSISRIFRECKDDIMRYKPDVILLVDFSGFNMHMAKQLKKKGYTIHYYIAPKVWAWNTRRVRKIKKYVDHLYCILPFETDFFRANGCNAHYVGNPVMDAICTFSPNPDFKTLYHLQENQKNIAILPGSRIQEVNAMLRTMISVCTAFPQYRFLIAAVSNLPKEVYSAALPSNATYITDSAYDILHVSDAAIVTSGTASLETALMNVPHVVCYRTSHLTYFLAKLFIKVPYISLVNLIAGKKVVNELIQKDFSEHNIKKELHNILFDVSYRERMLQGYEEVRRKIGNITCSEKTAQLIVSNAKK
ncbi:MAG: lipid-A-disaccharide synthase [Cytophagaceae bacterium]|nr:lipid-A-disaccharide synthase [Cytophagaceae bacterium]MDW8456949.1 lipid-A-disaccharide synthase [Cytophagaceae bacterium]